MPISIDQLEEEVTSLDEASTRPDYTDAFEHFVQVMRSEPDQDRMISILGKFRMTLSRDGSPLLDIVRRKARAMNEALVAKSVAEILEGINNRNPALSTLNSNLQNEIDKGNADADLLQRIKTVIDKTSATVDEVKNLVDQLTLTSATTKSRLKALIEAATNISNIILPNEG